MIQVDVAGVVVVANVEIAVLLKEQDGERTLPIFVGVLEANSIYSQLNHQQFPRPLTHDLFKNVLDALHCTVLRVEVCDLVDTTFIGKLVLEQSGQTIEIDSRPSDAISLALRFSAPILVAEKVMANSSKVLENVTTVFPDPSDAPTPKATTAATEQPVTAATNASPIDRAKADLAKAIKEERYEDAAGVRDLLRRLAAVDSIGRHPEPRMDAGAPGTPDVNATKNRQDPVSP
jgi:hypothetical protein